MFIIMCLYHRLVSSLYSLGTDRIENTASNRSLIVVGVSVATDMCIESLPNNGCLRQSCHIILIVHIYCKIQNAVQIF
jgi:hypothetical protein